MNHIAKLAGGVPTPTIARHADDLRKLGRAESWSCGAPRLPFEMIVAAKEELNAFRAARLPEKHRIAAVAAFVGSWPQRHAADIGPYCDAMAELFGEYPPPVVAAACRRAVREFRWPPPVAAMVNLLEAEMRPIHEISNGLYLQREAFWGEKTREAARKARAELSANEGTPE